MKSLGKFPDSFAAEIAGQPAAIVRAAEGLVEQRAALERVRSASRAATSLVFTGMGSSYFSSYPAVTELGERGVPAVMVDAAELLHFRRPMLSARSILVAVSQSGESAELAALARALDETPQAHTPVLVSVTNGLDNTLARSAHVAIDTLAGEEIGPSTLTFVAGLVVLAGVGRVLAGSPVDDAIRMTSASGADAAAAASRLLADPPGFGEQLDAWLGGRATLVALGRGAARAAAEMGALTLKEAARVPAESLETAQFRHGPLELAGPHLAAAVLATEPATHMLDLRLAGELAASGAAVLTVTADGHGPVGAMKVAIGPLDRLLAPAVAIAPLQVLAWRLAALEGDAPGTLRLASKVTTHE